MRSLSSYAFRKYEDITAISIGVNPDIYYNIIEVLLDVGYSISTELQHRSDIKNRKKSLEAYDVSRMIENSSNFLHKSIFKVENNDDFKDKLVYLRLYRREFIKPKIIGYSNISRKMSNEHRVTFDGKIV